MVVDLVRGRPLSSGASEWSRTRYRRILLSSGAGLAARGAETIAGLLTVPIALNYLGKDRYGLWVAVSSIVIWTRLFDFGMANGLVNAISESYGRDDRESASRYLSSAFFALTGVAVVLAALSAVFLPLIPWSDLLNLPHGDEQVIERSVAAAVGIVLVGLPLGVVRQMYAGYQRAYIPSMFTVVSAGAGLAAFIAAVRSHQSLPVIILCYGVPGLVVAAVNLVVALKRHLPWLHLSIRFVTRGAFRRLAATSVPLFLFQVGALLVNETDIVILTRRAGLREVAAYSVLMQVYMLLISLIPLSTNAFLPSFREAVERGDAGWARRAFRRMLKVRLSLAVTAFPLFLILGNTILRVWLHRTDVTFEWQVWLLLAVLLVTATWVTAFSDLLTIMDRIWVQVGLVFINGLVTPALIYVLAPRYGVKGVVLALLAVSAVVLSWLVPLLSRGLLESRTDAAGAEPEELAWTSG